MYSDFLYNILPIILLTNSYIPIIVYNNFLYNILSIILLINPHSVLLITAHNKSIDKLALSVKYLSNN